VPFSFASPEDLDGLQRVLDQAWARVVERHGSDPLNASGERERLAYIVAALWQKGVDERIAERAAEQFELTAPRLTPPLKPDSELK